MDKGEKKKEGKQISKGASKIKYGIFLFLFFDSVLEEY